MRVNRFVISLIAITLAVVNGVHGADASGDPPRDVKRPLPIIDMHLHAHTLDDYGGGVAVCTNEHEITYPGVDPSKQITFDQVANCESPMPPAGSNDALMRESVAILERYNIWAVTSGSLDQVSAWTKFAKGRITPAISFASQPPRPVDDFRKLFKENAYAVFAEIGAQYRGVSLDDERYEPYFALAEELDIPIGVHLGEGPPGAAYLAYPNYRAALTTPFQLEKVLIRHPKLRLYAMHYGSPLVDEMIAMLYSHPQLYVDVAQNDWGFPRAHFYNQLKRLIDAGFEKRIMWGSDQMIWPQTIVVAMNTIQEAPFLSEKQKRDIFYNNAARFLRLSDLTIKRHHGE
jgi:predicted TIM-barrel fold metal-dependent hydrolase